MASAATIADPGSGQGTAKADPPRIVRLWSDKKRGEQIARLKVLELQLGDTYGNRAWELAEEARRNLPEWARVDLPRAHVLGRILGMLRTGATLKTGKMLRLELSAQDIADRIGVAKSTVEAALRWLGCGAIEHHGEQIGRGLGLIHRGRRTALGFLHGKLRRVYRTSQISLTTLGRLLLGLGASDEVRKQQKREAYRRRKAEAAKKQTERAELEQRRRELEHIEGQSHGSGGGEGTPGQDTPEVARHWLNEIQKRL